MLIRLQALDLRRQRDKEGLAQIPEKLKIAEKPLLEAQALVEKAQAELDRVNKEKKDKELALQVAEEKIKKLKSRLTDLKTNKEYTAHLQEIAAANKEKEDTEDRLLLAMENVDLLKKALAEQDKILKDEKARFDKERAEAEATLGQIAKEDEKLEQEWLSLSKEAPSDLLESYRKLCALRKGLAVVHIEGHTCTGCHFSLPPQLIAEVKKREKILTCTYCNRMLYIEVAPSPS